MSKSDWNHPLPFGDSVWVKKSDVEPLVKAVKALLDNVSEFGEPTDSIFMDWVESAYNELTKEKQ